MTDEAELHRFLRAAAADTALATFRGEMYERRIVIPRLVDNASDLVIDQLSPAPPAAVLRPALLQTRNVKFPRLPVIRFRTVQELQTLWAKDSTDAIFVPRSTSFPVVDFVLRIRGQAFLANATVGKCHEIMAYNAEFAEVVRIAGLGSEEQEVPFLWFLDTPAFEGFTTLGQVKKVAAAGDLPAAFAGRIVQYKVQLDVPPWPRALVLSRLRDVMPNVSSSEVYRVAL